MDKKFFLRSPWNGGMQLDKLYKTYDSITVAGSLTTFPIVGFTNKASDTFREVLDDVKGGYDNKIHPKLFELYKDNYHKGISVLSNSEPDSKYAELYEKFKLNTSRLAAYKAYKATELLKDLPEKNFDVNAMQLLKNFNRYQATEYNAIVARSRTAKQYLDFQQDADLYPNMEWIMTRSADPREEHLTLVGTVRPINDPFWDENQPGNLWGCKCDWQPTDKDVTGAPEKEVKPATGLDGNPALTGELITDEHPYISKINDRSEIESFCNSNIVKPVLDAYKQTIDAFNGTEIINDKLATGQMTILRNSVKQIERHNSEFQVKISSLFISGDINNWEYLGWANEDHHPEGAYFLYYKTIIHKQNRFINVMVHKNLRTEVPYAILNTIDMKRVKKGLPDDIDKWTKK